MLFNSFDFLCFLPVVFLLYWAVGDYRWQNVLLLVAGYVFYGWWDVRFVGLLAFVSAVAFAAGIAIERWRRWSKWALGVSVVVNLGVLAVFKYFNFFADGAADLLRLMGMNPDLPTLQIVLPVGISFYTFQAMSYTIDVARRHVRATRNAVRFFAYISFFPQLVAGPIERANSLLPQFGCARVFNDAIATDGLRQMLWGLFKKMVVADNCAVAVDAVWLSLDTASAAETAFAALLFAMQIYADFSGYSDIAVGCARLFGFELSQNFRYPYFSADIAEFWRRWHISLTSWLRDYVYIPLGGSREGEVKTIRNILIVWALSGLWHGAAWTFVAWGVWHGTLIVAWRLSGHKRSGRLSGVAITFFFVALGWILFRAENLAQAGRFLITLLRWHSAEMIMPIKPLLVSVVASALMLAAEWRSRDCAHALQWSSTSVMSRHPSARIVCYLALTIVICVYAGTRSQFIYFQF